MPYINIGDIKLYFEIYGSELTLRDAQAVLKPTLLVLHGGPGTTDHTMYVDFWSKLSEIAQVVFVDQRGNGRSDHGNPDLWNLTQCGKDIHSFCKALGIYKPIVAGVSWGGYVAMSYATQFPEDLGGLIFCNTEAKVSPAFREQSFRNLVSEKSASVVKKFDLSCGDSSATAEYITHCLPYFAKNSYNKNEISRCIKNIAMREKFLKEENLFFNFLPKLHLVQCNTLVLAGASDPAHPLECAKETANALPKNLLEFHIIENAGAPIYKDQSEQCLLIISKFINRTYKEIYNYEQTNAIR